MARKPAPLSVLHSFTDIRWIESAPTNIAESRVPTILEALLHQLRIKSISVTHNQLFSLKTEFRLNCLTRTDLNPDQ
jgi:hypothetical protein